VGTVTQTGGSASVAGVLYLGYSSTGDGTYNLNGGTLALHGLTGGAGAATFNFGGGTLRADADFTAPLPMTLTGNGGNATVNTNGHAVSLSGTLTGIGGLAKTGSGTLTLSAANNYSGTTTVAGGTLRLVGTSIAAPGAWNPVLNFGGADVQAGKLVFDYSGGTDPIATIKAMLAASCDAGRWDVGQFRDSTAAANGLTLGWLDNPTTHQITVMATIPGDFNLDGTVNNSDLAVWYANVCTGTTWAQGDANYDGTVNGLDRDILLANSLRSVGNSSLAVPVPEPGTIVLLAAGLLGLIASAWRR
jgi:autotransporter-associated beta strand protein